MRPWQDGWLVRKQTSKQSCHKLSPNLTLEKPRELFDFVLMSDASSSGFRQRCQPRALAACYDAQKGSSRLAVC